MAGLVQQRCFIHAGREAAARCPECSRFFCRECVSEHDDRVICSSCLARLTAAQGGHRRRLGWLSGLAQAFAGFVLLWLVLFWIGRMLAAIPADVHENTVWSASIWDAE
jgi:hypothetical protein